MVPNMSISSLECLRLLKRGVTAGGVPHIADWASSGIVANHVTFIYCARDRALKISETLKRRGDEKHRTNPREREGKGQLCITAQVTKQHIDGR